MSATSAPKVQLSVRVDENVVRRLDELVAQARRVGQRLTKERLVADAIMTAYPDSAIDLPVHQGALLASLDPRSNTALLDFLDSTQDAQ